jgi:hypothetical protein
VRWGAESEGVWVEGQKEAATGYLSCGNRIRNMRVLSRKFESENCKSAIEQNWNTSPIQGQMLAWSCVIFNAKVFDIIQGVFSSLGSG